MTTFWTLLTGGGLLAAGGLLSGLLTSWLDARRDSRGYAHQQAMAREARRQDRLDRAYTELGTYLSRNADWADSVHPFWGEGNPPERMTPEERWRAEALVTAYGSAEVRDLLGQWRLHAARLDHAGETITRAEQQALPDREFQEMAQRERQALPEYKKALHEASQAIRDLIHRELTGDPPAPSAIATKPPGPHPEPPAQQPPGPDTAAS